MTDKTILSDNKHETKEHATVDLQMIATSQAAYYADHFPLKPCNWVKVYGPPGHTLTCNISAGEGEIIGLSNPSDNSQVSQLPSILYDGDGTSYGAGPYSPTLDTKGVTWFLVRGRYSSKNHAMSELAVITVNAKDQQDEENSATKEPTFQNYWDANPQNDPNQHFICYNYTSRVPADGATPACIYIKADSASPDVVRVNVTEGNATVIGAPPKHPHWRDVTLDGNGYATILLVNKAAESIKFTIGLPNVPGTDQLGPFKVDFYSFP